MTDASPRLDGPPEFALPFDLDDPPFSPVETSRLVLRPLEASDALDVWEYQRLPEVLRYIPWPERTPDEGRAHTEKRAGLRRLEKDEDAVFFAMLLIGEPRVQQGIDERAGASERADASSSADATVPAGASAAPNTSERADASEDAGGTGPADGTGRANASGWRVIGDVMLRADRIEHGQLEIGWVVHPAFQGRGLAREAAGAVMDLAFDTLRAHRVHALLDARNAASAALCERLGMRREATILEEEYNDGEWQDTAMYGILRREWAARRVS